MFETSEHYTLMSIPFFVLAGVLMSTGGVAKRMVNFAIAAVGHLRGGLAIASVLACMLFAAVSGSSPATVVAIGSIVIAGMVKNGYPMEFGAGVICNAGTLGILIPPSIVMVVYAAVTEVSVGRMFMAGVVPGLVLGFMLMVAVWWRAGKLKTTPPPKASFGEVLRALRESLWGLALLGIIMGGIYGGVFTPTEAAAVSAVYALGVAVFIYRDLRFKDLPHVFLEAGRTTVMLMFIMANALLFAHVLTTERIPADHCRAHHGHGHGALDVPDGGQRHPADRRQLHGAHRHHPDFGADLLPDCHAAGHRPHPPGHHHGGEHGDRHGDAAGGAEPVRDQRGDRHEPGAGGARRVAVADGAAGLPGNGDLHPADQPVPAGVDDGQVMTQSG
jgi:hypothetical protein